MHFPQEVSRESDVGSVLRIIGECNSGEFIVGYCREAIADRWGVYCENPFRRVPDISGRIFWAEYHPEGWFIYKEVRIQLVREEEWMKGLG